VVNWQEGVAAVRKASAVGLEAEVMTSRRARWLLLAGLVVRAAAGCTLFAAAGPDVEGGGCLLAKNRDWRDDGHQSLRIVKPAGGQTYYSLYVSGGDAPGTKAGVNVAGLAVVMATVGTIPKAERQADHATTSLLPKLLSHCASVAEALGHEDLFQGPRFLLLADRAEIAMVEIGLDGRHAVQRAKQGVLTHTNHYLLADMLGCNETKPGLSSTTRLARVGQLLTAAPRPLTAAAFETIAHDQHDGPDNSLFRLGSKPGATRTQATFLVSLPPAGAPRLVLRLFDAGEAERCERVEVVGN
jgi:hypothetical protein